MDFIGLSEVYFLWENITMKDIFNPYLSNDKKDILCEMQRLEEVDATLSHYSELFQLSTNATALCGQTNAVAKPISADC